MKSYIKLIGIDEMDGYPNLDKVTYDIAGIRQQNIAICMPSTGGTKIRVFEYSSSSLTNMTCKGSYAGELDRFRNLNLSFADSAGKK